jgi:hypothetical protein
MSNPTLDKIVDKNAGPRTYNQHAGIDSPVASPALPFVAADQQGLSLEQENEMRATAANLKNAQMTTQDKVTDIDFSKMSEKDIYDLSVHIPTYTHELPDYLQVKISDGNYVTRWVNSNSATLGQRIAQGWTYVKAEDLAQKLNVAIEPNENGVFKYVDVVLMKLHKSKYFGMLRANHVRGENMVKPDSAHRFGRAEAENMLSEDPGYRAVKAAGTMEVYAPGLKI